MKFSIVTPSFRQSEWLKLCVASVHDQAGVELEHIVQDAGSTDGTQDWLPNDPRVKAIIEKDQGMYDAVNRGWRRAGGDILAYLNCDEQYLPGALQTVSDFFAAHPRIEAVFAGSIVTDAEGGYICHRHALVPHPRAIFIRFPVLTSSLFIRRRVIHERGIFFDTRWRILGDLHWVVALLRHHVPMAVCDQFTSAFSDTGDNLCLKPEAAREQTDTDALVPGWVKLTRPAWVLHHHFRRWAAGHFSTPATSYSIYTRQSPKQRVTFAVPKPTALWRSRGANATRQQTAPQQ